MTFQARVKKIIPLTPARLEELALRYVSRYSATAGMLKKTLRRHVQKAAYQNPEFEAGPFHQAIENILQRYAQKGWIDDASFARRMAEHAGAAGISKNRLAQKLHSKGITGAALKEVLEAGNFDAESEWNAALVFAKKKYIGPWRRKEDIDRNKEIARLARAGFALDIAMKIARLKTGSEVTP